MMPCPTYSPPRSVYDPRPLNPDSERGRHQGRRVHHGRRERDDIMPLAGPPTQVIDLKGRRVLPGLIDNHLHIIRGGLNFNMELRWDGVRSLADAMAMLKRQVAITPPPQWVRVVGGFTEHQFAEKRLPTIDELNAVAPDTPVFLLHLYDRAISTRAALRAVGYTKDTPGATGRRDHARCQRKSDGAAAREAERRHSVRDARQGTEATVRLSGQFHASLHARVQPPRRHRRNRRRRRFQNYPEDYAVIQNSATKGSSPSVSRTTSSRKSRRRERDDFLNWTKTSKYKQGNDYFRHNGAGEMLVFSAADFEDFRAAASRYADGDGGRARRRGPDSRREPLAVADARDV